jgi:hypothetical protein
MKFFTRLIHTQLKFGFKIAKTFAVGSDLSVCQPPPPPFRRVVFRGSMHACKHMHTCKHAGSAKHVSM